MSAYEQIGGRELCKERDKLEGAWVAQSVNCPILDFSSGPVSYTHLTLPTSDLV